jgi:hypothetical protein
MRIVRTIWCLSWCLSLAPSASAEWRLMLPTPAERQAANVASWTTAVAVTALDAKASWECPDRLRCFELQGVRTGVTYGVVFLVKNIVQRDRPCAPDGCGIDDPRASFYSAHTALAFQAIGGPRLAFTMPLAITTGGLRVAAGKHWLTDVLVGAGAGALTSRIR